MKTLSLIVVVSLLVVGVAPALANDTKPETPAPQNPQMQPSQPRPNRGHWVRKRMAVLEERHEDFKAARLSAKLGGYHGNGGMPIPYTPTQADREAIQKYLQMKRQHDIDQFELKALRRELQRRSEHSH